MRTSTVISQALGRLQTALKYGPDMASSREVCIRDALALLAPLSRLRGRVRWFNDSKGYGFVDFDGGPEGGVFAHYSAIHGEGFKTLAEGQEIEFELVTGPTGPQCGAVWKLDYVGQPMRCLPEVPGVPGARHVCLVCRGVA